MWVEYCQVAQAISMACNAKNDSEVQNASEFSILLFDNLIQPLLDLLSSFILAGAVRTQPTAFVPPPFHMMDDSFRWTQAAQDYSELLPPPDRKVVLLSTTEGEANDIV
ncbi:unnamed protein product [Echinostoma caproni]|uniref:Mediator of RNA polymerase II transcription subunit 33A n=1 Tax=Echinostoma caproni TaxID=27848 RepID=A0A183AY12_9TREM|nr:unnamed protein product [Echinostoma caproni]